jgi:hypothetical protein
MEYYTGFLDGIIVTMLPSMLALAWLVWRQSDHALLEE